MFTVEVESDLELALVERSFASEYLKIVQDERESLGEWLAWPAHAENEEFFLTFIEKSLSDYALGKSMNCAIIFKGKVVGNISFNTISRELDKVEIGYWLSSDFRGQGLVSKSVSKLIDVAFNELKISKVQISAAAGNTQSRRVCERLHFTLEGTITHAENLNGRIVDHAVYGLHKDSWQQS